MKTKLTSNPRSSELTLRFRIEGISESLISAPRELSLLLLKYKKKII